MLISNETSAGNWPGHFTHNAKRTGVSGSKDRRLSVIHTSPRPPLTAGGMQINCKHCRAGDIMSKNDAVIYYKHALTVATAVHAFSLYSCQDKLKNTGCLLKSQHKEGKERDIVPPWL